MIKPAEFIHPEDAAALRRLEGIPGFTALSKKFLEYGYEKLFYGQNVASTIRLSPTQLPQIYKRLPPICDKLEMEEPEFYLEMNPIPNACTFGDTYKFIRVTSGLIEMLDDDEVDAVLAHECGHIICRHSLYHTMVKLLWSNGAATVLSKDVSEALLLALLYWSRKGELSCDRVAAAVTSPETVSRMMVRLSGGSKILTANVNIKEWAAQAERYHEIYNDEGIWNKAIQMYSTMYLDHPFAAVRVREILNWSKTDNYFKAQKLINNSFQPRCHNCGRLKENSTSRYCLYCGAKL